MSRGISNSARCDGSIECLSSQAESESSTGAGPGNPRGPRGAEALHRRRNAIQVNMERTVWIWSDAEANNASCVIWPPAAAFKMNSAMCAFTAGVTWYTGIFVFYSPRNGPQLLMSVGPYIRVVRSLLCPRTNQ